MYPERLFSKQDLPGYRESAAISDIQKNRLLYLKPYVRQSSREIRQPGVEVERKHLDYLLVCFFQGSGKYVLDSISYDVSPGSLFWVPPGLDFSMHTANPGLDLCYIHFDLIYDAERSHWDANLPGGTVDLSPWKHLMHPEIIDHEINALKGIIDIPNSIEIGVLMDEISKIHLRDPVGSMVLLSALMQQLLFEILKGCQNVNRIPEGHYLKIKDSAHFIMEHLHSQLDVHALSYRVGYSASYFRKLFKEVYHVSPGEYHRLARIRLGKNLLRDSHKSITYIAESLGFSTVQNFSRAFKQVIGLSPNAYRENKNYF